MISAMNHQDESKEDPESGIREASNSTSTNLLSTNGTATTGFFFRPSTMSDALSPYILKQKERDKVKPRKIKP